MTLSHRPRAFARCGWGAGTDRKWHCACWHTRLSACPSRIDAARSPAHIIPCLVGLLECARSAAQSDSLRLMQARLLRASATSAHGLTKDADATAHAVRTLHQQTIARPAVAATATSAGVNAAWRSSGLSGTASLLPSSIQLRSADGGSRPGSASRLHSQWCRHKSCGIIGLPNGQRSS